MTDGEGEEKQPDQPAEGGGDAPSEDKPAEGGGEECGYRKEKRRAR